MRFNKGTLLIKQLTLLLERELVILCHVSKRVKKDNHFHIFGKNRLKITTKSVMFESSIYNSKNGK